jgi:hypothetical protein
VHQIAEKIVPIITRWSLVKAVGKHPRSSLMLGAWKVRAFHISSALGNILSSERVESAKDQSDCFNGQPTAK